jgi:Xaa-Pro aminopeptidase
MNRESGSTNYDLGFSPALEEFMATGWAPRPALDETAEVTTYTQKRRAALSAAFPGELLVIPTGAPKVRSNDTAYDFRPGTDYVYFTGDADPYGVLVLLPSGAGHDPICFRHEIRSRDADPSFYRDRQGEFWEGRRRTLAEASATFGIECRPLGELDQLLAGTARRRQLTGIDPAVDRQTGIDDADSALAATCSELRLTKDEFEVAQLENAVAATAAGFRDIVARLPEALRDGERLVEGAFSLRARVLGNGNGYNPIAASGPHATVLHWTRNDGPVRAGDLLLVDAGVENRWYYTADVTRTIPVNGRFSPQQRQVYELVLAAQQAGLAAVRPGAQFRDYHFAAMEVLARGLADMGVLPKPAEADLGEDSRLYRRWTLHGAGHMLGIDVHDCAKARGEEYFGPLKPGYVLTVEPGLYFQPDDLTVPPELRGIGVRIEDDVLVTEEGARNLSADLPRRADDIEAWVAGRH